jgi:hypothetical protein
MLAILPNNRLVMEIRMIDLPTSLTKLSQGEVGAYISLV